MMKKTLKLQEDKNDNSNRFSTASNEDFSGEESFEK